ncbi:MAG TPA: BLUF domain-containing protein [Solirubrobacteraceae bacterium]|nr:BLUF domain-containing protein [Solirubrobacteraceae bacterium]
MTYVSSATDLFSTQQLTDLLRRSRDANERAAISGMLLYKDGNFMQTVEGPREAVDDLEARLARDPRHRGMLVLLRGEREQREFDGWSMGFRDLTVAAELAEVEGYSEFLETPLTADAFGADPDASQRLLLAFKRHM